MHVSALPAATVAVIFGVPALLLVAYGIHGGMPWDQSLVALSEANPGLKGYFLYYDYDPLRGYTNIFYHLAYHLDGVLGIPGSWFGYHAVFALLLSAKGGLVYWLSRLFQLDSTVASGSAALAVLHGSDSSIGHVGQLNQFGVAFFVLLSMSLFLTFLRTTGVNRYLLVVGSALAAHLALWSHEASLFGLLAYPTLFAVLYQRTGDKAAVIGVVIATLPSIIYASLMLDRLILHPTGASFQEVVLRKDLTNLVAVGNDYLRLLRGLFWMPEWLSSKIARGLASWEAIVDCLTSWPWLIASLLLLVFCVVLGRSMPEDDRPVCGPATPLMLVFLASAFLVPYLALDSLRDQMLYWRTQNLSVPFASILIVIAILAVARKLRVIQGTVFGGALLLILAIGFAADAQNYSTYNRMWDRFRDPIARLLLSVPSVKPGTIVMVQNVPSKYELVANSWFDWMLRLAYPHILVAGSYTYAMHDPLSLGREIVNLANGKKVLGEGHLFKIVGDRVELSRSEYYPLIQSGKIEQAIVLQWTDSGPFHIVRDASKIDMAVSPDQSKYHPDERIEPTLSDISRRRWQRMLK